MKDNNINEEWLDHNQWQPDMPSPDVAWSDMLARLEKEMPVNTVLESAGKKSFYQQRKLYLIILLLLLLTFNHKNEKLHSKSEQSYSEKALPASTTISKSQAVIELNNNVPAAIAQEQALKNISSSDSHVPEMNRGGNKNYIHKTAPISTKKDDNTIARSKVISKDTVALTDESEIAALNSSKPNTQKSTSTNARLTDSLENGENDNEQALSVQAGLQWTMPLPVAGTSNYFAGTSGTEQPWRVLLPGVWVSIKADKNLLMAEINPFESASFNPKSFYSNQQVDSLAILERFKSITKVFGLSGAISFQHNIINNWWAGAGLQASFWNKGAAILTENKHDNTTNTSTSFTQPYVLSKDDWQYFSKFQLYPHLQLMYRGSKYQAGLRTGATFTALSKDNGAKNLVFTELFFRLPLISNNKK